MQRLRQQNPDVPNEIGAEIPAPPGFAGFEFRSDPNVPTNETMSWLGSDGEDYVLANILSIEIGPLMEGRAGKPIFPVLLTNKADIALEFTTMISAVDPEDPEGDPLPLEYGANAKSSADTRGRLEPGAGVVVELDFATDRMDKMDAAELSRLRAAAFRIDDVAFDWKRVAQGS